MGGICAIKFKHSNARELTKREINKSKQNAKKIEASVKRRWGYELYKLRPRLQMEPACFFNGGMYNF